MSRRVVRPRAGFKPELSQVDPAPSGKRMPLRDDSPQEASERPTLHPARKGTRVRIVTIGVYGSREGAFFSALTRAGVDTFCDIRRRRGLRGSAYAFANSRRLQERLGSLGIRYLHLEDLAPSRAVRDVQHAEDDLRGVGRRERTVLSPAFVRAYKEECLRGYGARRFLDAVGADARVVALFCVEREPEACHRSIVAGRLSAALRTEPEHIRP